jgi:hypothetical protein
MLSWWQWAMLASVPPAIVLLYFLKLKRQPVEVPSTYLWHKMIEDLHVNTIWQRLRRSLLLFLQLLLVALVILALGRPSWRGARLSGGRYVFLIDASASMAATDVEPSRLEAAKQEVLDLIAEMASGDVAMVVSFSDTARVEQLFTDNRAELRRKVQAIQQTDRPTNVLEALRVASGLANPGRSGTEIQDTRVAEARPARLFIFTDGRFPDVPGATVRSLEPLPSIRDDEEDQDQQPQAADETSVEPQDADPASEQPAEDAVTSGTALAEGFSLGNLDPQPLRIVGTADADNVGIVAFSTGRNEERPDQLQAFARLENFGPRRKRVDVTLLLNGELIDADRVTLPAREARGVAFSLDEEASGGVLELRIDTPDHLAIDNRAWAVINQPRKARVLLVTEGNEHVLFALTTGAAQSLCEVTEQPPSYLQTPDYRNDALLGNYDLVIFDRCAPPAELMPQSNTLFIAQLPPAPAGSLGQAAASGGQKTGADAGGAAVGNGGAQRDAAGGGDQPSAARPPEDMPGSAASESWSAGAAATAPQITDTDRSHPMMHMIDMGDVLILEGTPLAPPRGSTVLIDSTVGPLAAIAPREGFEDVVLGFAVGGPNVNTNWPVRLSFPVFVLNALQYLGGGRAAQDEASVKPGQPFAWRSTAPVDEIRVRPPSGGEVRVQRGPLNTFPITETSKVGLYEVREGRSRQASGRFAVNLFDDTESNLRPRTSVKLGHVEVKQGEAWEPARHDAWKWILLAALAVLAVEWYIYNRRVHV